LYQSFDYNFKGNGKIPTNTAWNVYKLVDDSIDTFIDTIKIGPISKIEEHKYHTLQVRITNTDSINMIVKASLIKFDSVDWGSHSKVIGRYFGSSFIISLDAYGLPFCRYIYILLIPEYGSGAGSGEKIDVYMGVSDEAQ